MDIVYTHIIRHDVREQTDKLVNEVISLVHSLHHFRFEAKKIKTHIHNSPHPRWIDARCCH